MIIDAISDLHGHYPKLEGGDLLIVAGDLTARDINFEYAHFNNWLANQMVYYKLAIVIGGNHDNHLQKNPTNTICRSKDMKYLCDSGTEFEGLKIWGSPWTKTFKGINPKCTAFTLENDQELAKKWELIPEDVDILITHSPPYGILDKIDFSEGDSSAFSVGSKSLAHKIGHMETPPKLWVWGHIHESYGEDLPIRSKPCRMINASHVNERYEPVNKPIRVIL